MTLRKKFKILLSEPIDKMIVSMEFSTEIEEETQDEEELFQRAYSSTLNDIANTSKSDPGVKKIWKDYLKILKEWKANEVAKEAFLKEYNDQED